VKTGERAEPLYRLGRALFRVLFRLYNRWEVSGRDLVPESGSVLLIANHTSYADPPIVGSACRRPVHFMAKAELFFFPLGAIISRTHAFPVRRGGVDRAALRRARQLLEEGRVLLVFPEGTRSPNGRLMELETGAAFLALSSRAQVVPAGIDGADRLLPRRWPIPRPAKLRVRFGPPVKLDDLRGPRPTREALEEATRRMDTAMRQLLPRERR
jgi:1-acyl-sn-glycerol-3-phosphate acyltransferase